MVLTLDFTEIDYNIFWCITYLIPRNELHNPEYHHGLDTDYKDLKGDALANAKVRDSVVIPTWIQAQVLIEDGGFVLLYYIRFHFVLQTPNKGHIWLISCCIYGLCFEFMNKV